MCVCEALRHHLLELVMSIVCKGGPRVDREAQNEVQAWLPLARLWHSVATRAEALAEAQPRGNPTADERNK